MRFLSWSGIAVLLCHASLAAGDHTAGFTRLQPADLFSARSIDLVELSPDAREILFVTTEANLASDRFVKTIWRAPAVAGAQVCEPHAQARPRRWQPHRRL